MALNANTKVYCMFRVTNCYFAHWGVVMRTWDIHVSHHDDVIKWKLFPRYWPFVWIIHQSPVNSPQKGPVTRSFDVPLMLARANSWVKRRVAGGLRRHDSHCDVIVMIIRSGHGLFSFSVPIPYLNQCWCFSNLTLRNKYSVYIYFWSKVNIWNVNCARATAFIFDTRTGVLGKVSKIYLDSFVEKMHLKTSTAILFDIILRRMSRCFVLSGCRAEMSHYTGYIRTPNVQYPPEPSPDYGPFISCEWIIKAGGKLVTFERVSRIRNSIDTTAATNDRYEVSDTYFHLRFQRRWATCSSLTKTSTVSTLLVTHICVIGQVHHCFNNGLSFFRP